MPRVWLMMLLMGALGWVSEGVADTDSGGLGSARLGSEGSVSVFLVRHAEKQSSEGDPALSERGEQRAQQLAQVLRDVTLTHIWSSDYRRTRDTAGPVAHDQGVKVALYDPRDLPAMAEQLLSTPGVHLVVGHSNTTPALVELLGGDPGTPIREADEYNRLYWVLRNGDAAPVSHLLRFGGP